MVWQEMSVVSSRREFVALAHRADSNVSELCRRFGISRSTGYKWLSRQRASADCSFADLSRRPSTSPGQTPAPLAAAVVSVRQAHPCWGGRKIRAVLLRRGLSAVPAASTITGILARHGLIDAAQSEARLAPQRFEHEAPNRLWQMDFKGHFALSEAGRRCHPLTVVDDHSRFAVTLAACGDERTDTVQAQLTATFCRYGLPERILTDNGAPWGSAGQVEHKLTPLTVWLLRLGIQISHSRPRHPQTHGKNERFNGTLKLELLDRPWRDLAHAQGGFDRWRALYNHDRPHEGIGFAVPADRYRPSPRSFPGKLPDIDYPTGCITRKVQAEGVLKFKGRTWRLPRALRGQQVALFPTNSDAAWNVQFVNQTVATIDLRERNE